LANLRPSIPTIFLDTEQEIGVKWPDNLAYSLGRSRCLVAVWSVPYFHSPWCMAEWRSMLKRQQLLGMGTKDSLVYPVVFADGDNFPKAVRAIQARTDLSRWNIPFPEFRETREYIPFYQAIGEVANKLSARLDNAPAWQPDWPVVRPKPKPHGRLPQPRL
jgi:hypothetical protein